MAQGTRIKDITTTATSAASDDFLVVDGATNGTRKIAKGNLASAEISAAVLAHDESAAAHGALFGPFSALRAAIEAGVSTSMTVAADSTMDAANEPISLFASWLAAKYPATSVIYRRWDSDLQGYQVPTRVSTGTAGQRLITLTGTGNTPTIASTTALSGDFYIAVPVIAADYTPAAQQVLADRGVSSVSDKGFIFTLETNGKLRLTYSTGGTAGTYGYTLTSADALPAGVIDNTTLVWLAVFYDRDDGAGGSTATFYYSTDGASFTSLGAQQRTTNNLIFASTSAFQLGATGASLPFIGKIGAPRIYAGLPTASAPLMPEETDLWVGTNGSTHAVTGAPELWIYNAAVSGSDLTYQTDAGRIASCFLNAATQFVFVCSAHNYGVTRAAYATALDNAVTAIRARCTECEVIVGSQNPQNSPRTTAEIAAQTSRCLTIPRWAHRTGARYVPIFERWVRDAVPLANFLDTDGVHPVAAGNALILAAMTDAYGA